KLRDASAMIRSLRRDIDAAAVDDEVLAYEVVRVTCEMVKRSLNRPAAFDGVRQLQDTTGPFSIGITPDNPSGDLYLTKNEKRTLGIGSQRAFMVDLIGEAIESRHSRSANRSPSSAPGRATARTRMNRYLAGIRPPARS